MHHITTLALDRRALLGAGALAAALGGSSAALSAAPGDPALEAAFRAAFAAPPGSPGNLMKARLAFLADGAHYIDSDVPFPMDRAAAADHLAFHAASWDQLEIVLSEVETAVQGETGIASAYFNLRGKPKDAGFRLRPGFTTAVCIRTPGGWRALSLHLSALAGQILDASPA